MIRFPWLLFVCVLLLHDFIPNSSSNRQSVLALDTRLVAHHDNRQLRRELAITCRLVLEDTLIGEFHGKVDAVERIRCIILQDNGAESDDLYPIKQLPEAIKTHVKEKLSHEEVYAELPGAFMNKRGHILLSDDITERVRLIPRPHHARRRRLSEGMERPELGTRNVTICRISTADAEPKYSAEDLLGGIFGNDGPNLRTQFEQCSFNQLKWIPSKHGVVDVKLPEVASFYDNDPYEMISHAHEIIRERFGVEQVSELSDRVLMCMPPKTGSWAASAAIGHWRAQFHNEWCLSLAGLMHEVGHTLGLRHANRNGIPYADMTGYMSSGSPVAKWPRKCFNGYKSWKLGFYKRRHIKLSPLSSSTMMTKPVKIMVATFVDFSRARTNQPVVVNLDDYLFLQYNRAKLFNQDTGQYKDMLVVTEGQDSHSDSRAGVDVGENFVDANYLDSGKMLVVRVCRKVSGANSFGPDYLEVLVGIVGTGDLSCDTVPVATRLVSGSDSAVAIADGGGSVKPTRPATTTPLPTPSPTKRAYRYRQRLRNAPTRN